MPMVASLLDTPPLQAAIATAHLLPCTPALSKSSCSPPWSASRHFYTRKDFSRRFGWSEPVNTSWRHRRRVEIGRLHCSIGDDDVSLPISGPFSWPQIVPQFGPYGPGVQVLPIMLLSKVKFPTEQVQLQLFESRYRAMFKLVNQSQSKRFGLILSDRTNSTMEAVGVVCELRTMLRIPQQSRIFVTGQVVGRFCTRRLLVEKPFVTAEVEPLHDTRPASLSQHAELAAAEMRVWRCMLEVERMAEKLYGHFGDTFSDDPEITDVHYWSPDGEVAKQLKAGKASSEDEEVQRRVNFSFAVARTLDHLRPEQQQSFLELTNTAVRFGAAEVALVEGAGYLAARCSLRDALS